MKQSNERRAERARAALAFYLAEDDDLQQAVADLLTDALHLASVEDVKIDWQQACLIAEINYEAEK
jgi:hypothetical protein